MRRLLLKTDRAGCTTLERSVDFQLVLCGTDPEVIDAYHWQFDDRPEAQIAQEDVLDATADAFILPGNSFGFLDSGLALRVSERHGLEIQDRLRARIRDEFAGELLVGQALLETTPSGQHLVYAPIWRTPRPIRDQVNVYLAVRGAFQLLSRESGDAGGVGAIRTVAVPPIGVEPPGEVKPAVSARQMRYGFNVGCGRRSPAAKNLTRLVRRERKLLKVPRSLTTDEEDEN